MAESVATMMLRAATNDLAACKVLDAAPGMLDSVIGFHAQQACEKCLKAVLSTAAIGYPRTHDLLRLMDLLTAQGIDVPPNANWIDELNPYAVDARYGMVEPGGLDRPRAIATVESLVEWAGGQVAGQQLP